MITNPLNVGEGGGGVAGNRINIASSSAEWECGAV